MKRRKVVSLARSLEKALSLVGFFQYMQSELIGYSYHLVVWFFLVAQFDPRVGWELSLLATSKKAWKWRGARIQRSEKKRRTHHNQRAWRACVVNGVHLELYMDAQCTPLLLCYSGNTFLPYEIVVQLYWRRLMLKLLSIQRLLTPHWINLEELRNHHCWSADPSYIPLCQKSVFCPKLQLRLNMINLRLIDSHWGHLRPQFWNRNRLKSKKSYWTNVLVLEQCVIMDLIML